MTHQPSGVLTMVYPNGGTHVEREQHYTIESAKLMEFVLSLELQERLRATCSDAIKEMKKRELG